MSVVGTCNNCMILNDEKFYISGSTTPLYLEVVNEDNQSLTNCVEVTSEVIRTNPEMIELDECGCPIDECGKASLRINIRKIRQQTTDCGFSGFTLDSNGLILFQMYDGSTTNFISSECCSSLGYTSELQHGINVCRWADKRDLCLEYQEMGYNGNYMTFSGPDGEITEFVPSSECCPISTTPQLQGDGTYKCYNDEVF